MEELGGPIPRNAINGDSTAQIATAGPSLATLGDSLVRGLVMSGFKPPHLRIGRLASRGRGVRLPPAHYPDGIAGMKPLSKRRVGLQIVRTGRESEHRFASACQEDNRVTEERYVSAYTSRMESPRYKLNIRQATTALAANRT